MSPGVMFTPIVITVVRSAELPALPYLLGLASASNIGGVVTLTGNPQNMIIGTTAGLSYNRFLLRMAPVGLLGLLVDAALLCYLFRHQLPRGPLRRPEVPPPPLDRRLVVKAVGVLGIVVLGFLGGRSMSGMALAGAAVLTLIARTAPRPVFQRVDWSLLLFFAGLFVVVEGAARTGALERAHEALAPLFGRTAGRQLVLFGLFSEIGSNVVSNVPYVLAARSWVPHLLEPGYQWTSLAMTSTLAGNLTLVGSVANLIAFELAGADGHVGFWRFSRYGIVITIATTALGFAILLGEMRLGL